MKTLYLDCNMGAAGDMLTAALLELHPDPEDFLARLNSLGVPGIAYQAQRIERSGTYGTRMAVTINGEEEHSAEILPAVSSVHSCLPDQGSKPTATQEQDRESLISRLPLPPKVREEVLAVYRLLAGAESYVHGKPVEEIHFHVLGTMDAIADITAVCLLMNELAPEQILASPVHVGCGEIRCACGILPVPAPATAWLLQGIPTYGGSVPGELCTPTGAALLKYFARDFCEKPQLHAEKIGRGFGQKELAPNDFVRVFFGESEKQ